MQLRQVDEKCENILIELQIVYCSCFLQYRFVKCFILLLLAFRNSALQQVLRADSVQFA